MRSYKFNQVNAFNSRFGSRSRRKSGRKLKSIAYCIQVTERDAVVRTSTPHLQRPNSRLLANSKLHPVSGGTTRLGFSDGYGDTQTDPRTKRLLFGDHHTLCAKAPTVSGLPSPAGISKFESPIAPKIRPRLSRIITYYHAQPDR